MTHPVVTVVLPMRQGAEIAWLALEGLARQIGAPPWELLVGEEICGEQVFGPDALLGWLGRLSSAGLVSYSHSSYDKPCELNQKVWDLAQTAAPTSETLLWLGCDDMPHPLRLAASHSAISSGVHLYQERVGLYFDIDTGSVAVYDAAVACYRRAHLNMAMRTSIAKGFPMDMGPANKTDGAFFRAAQDAVEKLGRTFDVREAEMMTGGVWTHGRNHVISSQRARLIRHCQIPFRQATDSPPHGLPADIWLRLGRLSL